MSAAYDTRDDLAPDDFDDCRRTFLTMLEDLSALEPTDEATLSERISDATKEVSRLALEATLGRMARYEPSERPRGADGVERTQSRTRGRSLVSIFGEVYLERRGAAAPGAESLFVADAWLNLGHGQLARYSLATASLPDTPSLCANVSRTASPRGVSEARRRRSSALSAHRSVGDSSSRSRSRLPAISVRSTRAEYTSLASNARP
jgi:hypothetical protein